MKKIQYGVKQEIITLSGKFFWYWRDFYSFYANILGLPLSTLENKFPKESSNKFKYTQDFLEIIEKDENKILLLFNEFYNLKSPSGGKDNPNLNEAKTLLAQFKENIGEEYFKNKEKERDFKEKINEKRETDNYLKIKENELLNLKNIFYDYAKLTDKNQERGYWIEKAFFKILTLEKIDNVPPYKNKHEQIDGHITFKYFNYLIETKWTEEQVKQKEISEFEGKIDGKGQSTRGVVLSISGFHESSISAVKKKTNPRIFFLDANDFISCIEGRQTMYDILSSRESNLSRKGIIYNEK